MRYDLINELSSVIVSNNLHITGKQCSLFSSIVRFLQFVNLSLISLISKFKIITYSMPVK